MAVETARKSVLITGCAPGGIGHALAIEFHSKGLNVIATARSSDALTSLADKGITTLSLDVTSPSSISALHKDLRQLLPSGLDILVNNAGRNYTMPGVEVDLDQVRETLETNFVAVIAMTQTFTPMLIQRKGLIVNIGSVAAIVPYVFGSVYNASKAALHAYSQTLRLELEPYGVDVMVIVTGGVQSRIARTKRTLSERSLYTEIESDFERRVTHSQDGAMSAEKYSVGVVKEALKTRRKKWVWRGNKSFLIWFVWNWLGGWVFDLVLPRMFGLRRLKALLKRARG